MQQDEPCRLNSARIWTLLGFLTTLTQPIQIRCFMQIEKERSRIFRLFMISQMIVPGSSYWNIGFGRNIGDVQEDTEGLQTMTDLGENMAWLLGKITD